MRVKDTHVMAHVEFIRLCNRKYKSTYHSKCCWRDRSDHGSGSNNSHRHQNKKTRNDSCNEEARSKVVARLSLLTASY